MTERERLVAWLRVGAVLGGCAVLGIALFVAAYQRHHSSAAMWSSVSVACGLFVFLTATWRLAQARRAKWVRLDPARD